MKTAQIGFSPGLPTRNHLIRWLSSLPEEEKRQLDTLLLAPRAATAKATTRDFGAWLQTVTPRFSWDWPHLRLIRAHLHRVEEEEIDRLCIFAPPRHGKSEQVTIRWPAYRLEHNPALRTIVGAYSQTLATKFSRRTRAIVRERDRVNLSMERYAADDWETAEGGGVRAAGVGTGVTGHGADLILIDDPVKSRAEANSLAYREACWDWYKDDLSTRLEPGGSIVLQMTRWHEDDLAGRILASEDSEHWTVLRLPALAEADDPLGRPLDAALCPERYDERKLARIHRVLGASFHALYQGRPTAAEGGLIKREWFRYWNSLPPSQEVRLRVQSWDTASKESELADWSVCTTWLTAPNGYLLTGEWRERAEYPRLRRAVIAEAEREEPDAVLIEDKGHGTALIQDLGASTSLPIVPVVPITDKVVRLSNQSIAYEAGLVYHPRPELCPWIDDFEAELVSIPNAQHDDRGDSVAQALAWLRHNTGRFDWGSTGRRAEYERELASAYRDAGLSSGRNDYRGF